jgi:hypothetical protein
VSGTCGRRGSYLWERHALRLKRAHFAVRSANRFGLEARWKRDFQHLQIFAVRDLGMDDAGRLYDGRPRLEPDAAHAFVLELDPAAKDVDELELQGVAVRPARLGRCAFGADDVRADASAGRRCDAEVAVGEEAAQSFVPARVARVVDGEAAFVRRVVSV